MQRVHAITTKSVPGILLMLLFASATQSGLASSLPATREWNFQVYLGDSAIGHHRFRLIEEDNQVTLVTEADFKVRLFFFTAYRYQHVNTEIWRGDCLHRIESHTDANGRILNVQGTQEPAGFRIRKPEMQEPVQGCIKSFAYWNPDILEEDVLLNPQTGELTDIDVQLQAEETLRVQGREVPARRYRLQTRDLALDVWYSSDSEWLALESTTKDGRTLRYELI